MGIIRGSPLHVKDEAVCLIEKVGRGEIPANICEKWGDYLHANVCLRNDIQDGRQLVYTDRPMRRRRFATRPQFGRSRIKRSGEIPRKIPPY